MEDSAAPLVLMLVSQAALTKPHKMGQYNTTGWCTGMTLRDEMGREGGEGSGWGTHVHSWLIHINAWQNHYNIIQLACN